MTRIHVHVARVILAIGLAARASTVEAQAFRCDSGDVPCLVAAINDANSNGHARNRILLAPGVYTLTSVDNDTDGTNGLPSITSDITIEAADDQTATLMRSTDPGIPRFRVFHVATAGRLVIRHLVVSGGEPASTPQSGGAIFNAAGTLIVEGSTISHNRAANGAGLTTTGGVVRLRNCAVTGNTALGEAIRIEGGSVRIDDSTIDGNSGAGVYNAGTLSLVGSRVANNHYSVVGTGGLDNVGTAWIRRTTFDSNIGITAAISVATGTVVISDSVFVRNQGRQVGGGVIANTGGAVWVTNCTFARNAPFVGGLPTEIPVVIHNEAYLVVTNATFAENTSPPPIRPPIIPPPAVLIVSESGATTILINTLFGANTNAAGHIHACSGSVVSLRTIFNDLTDCNVALQPTDVVGDPGLGEFIDDPEPGMAHYPLLPTSIAINVADRASCTKMDQIGEPRMGRCDSGAIEFQEPLPKHDQKR